MHILLVDDDPDVRKAMADVLTTHGHSVSEASDGEVALKILEVVKPDFMLLDLAMPRMDGITLIAKAKERKLMHCPFGVLSAYYPEQEPIDGAQFVLRKPVDPEAVAQRLDLMAKGQCTK